MHDAGKCTLTGAKRLIFFLLQYVVHTLLCVGTINYGGPQRQYTNIYYITAFYILVHKHIHWLRGYIYQYNKIYNSTTILYPSTEMLISVQKYKLQYGKISPILSTQITAPVKKNINLSVQKHKFRNKHIHRLCD